MSTRPDELQIPPWEELQALLLVLQRRHRDTPEPDEAPVFEFLYKLKEQGLLSVTAEQAWSYPCYDSTPTSAIFGTQQVKVIGVGKKPVRHDGPYGFYVDVMVRPFHASGYHGPFSRIYVDQLRGLQTV